MKKSFLLLLLSFFFIELFAQKHTVKLQLVEETTSQPVEFVTCEVKTIAEQPKTIDFGITDSLGKVAFELPNGKYDISATYMGQTLFEKTIEVIDELDLGQISVANGILLSEVVIKSYRPTLKNEKGRLIFNVKNSPLNKNYSASDLLVRTPSVTMSGSGIAIDGGAAELRINGIKQHLSGIALVSYLNSLKSDEVKQIEVQAGRTADVDADLPGGIINVVLEEKRGVKGYLESKLNYNGKSYEHNSKYLFNGSMGTGITAGTDVLQFYANVYGSHGRLHGVKSESNYLIKQIGKLIQENSQSPYNSNKYIDINSGLSYKLNKSNTLNIEGSYNRVPTTKALISSEISLSKQGIFIDNLFTKSVKESNSSQYAVTTAHIWKNSDKNAKLTTVFNYLYNKYENEQNIQSLYQTQPTNNVNELNSTENNSSMFYAQTKFDYTFKNKIRTIIGAKYTHTKRKNDYRFLSGNANSKSYYSFTEKLPAIFVNFDKTLSNGVFLSVGLRGEYTNLQSDNSEIKVDYFDLFPSLLMSYQLKNKWALRFNYSRSVFRPAFSLLNNYKIKISDYLYSVGNPTLEAQKTDFFKIGISKKRHSLSFSYSYSANPIAESIYTENNIVFIKNINSGNKHNISFNYGYNGKVFPVWYLSANAGISYINLPQSMYKKEIFQAYMSLYNNIKLSEKLNCNINSKYATPWIMDDRQVDERFSLSIDAKYKIKPSFTLTAGIKNLLSKGDSRSITDNTHTHYDYWREKAFRIYSIGLVYNFSKGKKVKAQKVRNENTDKYRVY